MAGYDWHGVNGLIKMLWTDAPCVAYYVVRDAKENREKKWPREILEAGHVLLAPRSSRGLFFFPRVSFGSGTTDWAKEVLLAVYIMVSCFIFISFSVTDSYKLLIVSNEMYTVLQKKNKLFAVNKHKHNKHKE